MLEELNFGKLTHLESGQHVKSVHNNLTASVGITDPAFLHYMITTKNAVDNFDESQVKITKSDETQKIEAADLERDRAFATLRCALNVFEYSKSEPHKLAFTSLDNLFSNYSGLQVWNYAEETNGIENLIADLEKPKYAAHVLALGLGVHIDRLRSDNDDFKALFSVRTVNRAETPDHSSKLLRQKMYVAYDDMANYIVAMSKVPNANEQFSRALALVNADRKYYSDMLAKRKGVKEVNKKP